MKVRWVLGIVSTLVVACGLTAHSADSTSFSISDVGYAKGGDCGCDKSDGKCDDGCDLGKGGKGAGMLGGGLFCVGDVEAFKLPQVGCIEIGGWTQIGYHDNSSIADGFNQYPEKVALHQQWLYAQKAADGSCGLDWGFRMDAMYGIDANNTQAFGNNPGVWDYQNGLDHGAYGFAMPQLYGELAYGDLSVIMGHFYTLVGYEVVTAPDNFFYSHAFTMNNSEPFTHTGVLATYGVSDRLTVYGGWTLGWDTGFDQINSGSDMIAGFGYSLTDAIDLTYIMTAGNLGWAGRDAYSHSIVFDVALTEKLNYVFQSDWVRAQEADYHTIGVNQYLLYSLNDCWGFGARLEWWKMANGGTVFGTQSPSNSYNAATFGLNWRPHTNVVVRPEVKQEWTPALDYDQTILGVDMVLTY